MAAVPVELVENARRLGAAYDVADLGDVSMKDASVLRVKRSGARLAELTVDDFVGLDRSRLDTLLETGFPRDAEPRAAAFGTMLLNARMGGEATPIVDSLIHHLLPGRVVVHLHPESLAAITCCGSGQYLTRDWFKKHEVPVLWLERCEEGVVLAKALAKVLAKSKRPAVDAAVLVSNGGVYLQAEEPAGLGVALERLLATLAEKQVQQEVASPEEMPAADPQRLSAWGTAFSAATHGQPVATDASAGVLALLSRPSVRDASLRGPILPDQVVHCGSYPCHVEDDGGGDPEEALTAALAEHVEENDGLPRVLLVRPHGLVACGTTPAAASIAAEVFAATASVYVRSELMGVTRIVPAKERRALEESRWTAQRRAAAAD
ncbi:class II aldolase/adducin family protein [Phycisphaera mikurensis]|uniref:Class II aldolase/adducin N-terminal domain-containing protein n=1 Tax=Phycisphaera mikurensis (strain NBRC 102666 / KCTC 22515 / FYK2301M01) TaxID=1142394 RepID=I0IH64_PHYMF|nr:class II aldolase/adducin family protein [Phycisphaera mikurensis]MBB6440854.1 rhamnose utilization protein RhaD (predicted bifunctional aldolase and dehydrogenase) [Phycisphaera mikurensis]BAM04602.1 hypothetical protein PSMK_24430 [Phycisphaera mikurensis NBRC 102666]